MNKYSQEKIKKIVIQIYETCGLDMDDMSEAELERICNYCYNNQDLFQKDLLKYNDIKNKILDDD